MLAVFIDSISNFSNGHGFSLTHMAANDTLLTRQDKVTGNHVPGLIIANRCGIHPIDGFRQYPHFGHCNMIT